MRDDQARVIDIIEACDQIVQYVGADHARFRSDPVIQAAAQRWLEIIPRPVCPTSSSANTPKWPGGIWWGRGPSSPTVTSTLTTTSCGPPSPAMYLTSSKSCDPPLRDRA